MSLNERLFVTRAQAVEALFSRWSPEKRTQRIPIQEALGRVTSIDVYSKNTLPVYRSSKCDGIAVRSKDFEEGIPDTKDWKKGIDFVQADTGDDFDDEFDAVIPIENVSYDGEGRLELSSKINVVPGARIKNKGETVVKGDLLVKAHTVLQPPHLCVLATGGYEQVEVYDRPKVAYIPTGSELVPLGTKPNRGQNIESNGIMVQSAVEQWGGELITYPIVKDHVESLRETLMEAISTADMVIINGGSAKGEEDYNGSLVAEESSWIQHGVFCVPGRPAALAMIQDKPVINMPGPPLACFSLLDWCIIPMVRRFLQLPAPIRPKVKAVLQDEINKPGPYEFYGRIELRRKADKFVAHVLTFDYNFPDMMSRCNGLFIAPIGRQKFLPGEEILVELLCGEEFIPYD
ncbi:MAG TPA: molybdopterin molybdenumtransferase MoeA [Clostridiales bacterium]|mgnify:FL=1|uniref:molybdopterin molybdotransferase MoeA n=1 Tax=Alkalibaculum bacchi TaxID=645887 RepID=UPI000EB91B14|nr:molybdopterin molybdotransferase MoeA [Alkalibaculum bacchi]HCS74671.1 molybdopterin molybdenumtransferase MoeA [Clostridiales bacterium]